jgi:hypothetical protein
MSGFEDNGALLSGQGQAQSLEILGAEDLVVDWVTLREQKGQVLIHIRNNDTARAQDITLQVVGSASLDSDTPSLLSVAPVEPVTHTVSALDTEEFVLQFDTRKEPKAGSSYSGTLVATGSLGGVVQRKLTLEVGTPSPTPVPDVPASESLTVTLRPDKGGNITMTGVSFLPSFLNATDPTQLYVSFLLISAVIILSLLLWQRRRGWMGLKLGTVKLPLWLLVEAVLTLIFVVAIAVNEGNVDPVVVNTMPASALSGVAPVTVMSPQGSLGTVRVADGFLRAESIREAGKYSGQIDLLPADDENAATSLAVNVADWWPWALLSVLAGILVSFWVTDYYQRRRAMSALKLERQELKATVEEDEAAYKAARSTWPPEYKGYSMQAVANDIYGQIERDLNRNDTKSAEEKVGQLRNYSTLFGKFHAELVELYLLQRQVLASTVDWWGVDRARVDVLVETERLLKGESPLDVPPEDRDGTKLKALEASVRDVTAWLMALDHILNNIRSYLLEAMNLVIPDGDNRDEIEKVLTTQKAALVECMRQALLADKKDDLGDISKSADVAYREILKIKYPVPGEVVVEVVGGQPSRNLRLAGIERFSDAVGVIQSSRGQRWRSVAANLAKAYYDLQGGGDAIIVMPEPLKSEPEESNRERFLKSSRAFRLDEQQMTAIAGLLTLLTGFTFLYFGNAAWGAPADYLNALLWGSGISSGLKLIINLVNRTWTNE